MKLKTIETYTFSELSDKAKAKALDNHRGWNVMFDWYTDEIDYLSEQILENHGIKIIGPVYFSTDREWFITPTRIEIVDIEKLAKNIDRKHKSTILAIGDYSIGIDRSTRDGRVVVEDNYRGSYRKRLEYEIGAMQVLLQSRVSEILHGMLTALRDQYEYLTSDEAITESLEANQCTFDADGDII